MGVDFRDYQKKARQTTMYPGEGDNLSYPALGLTGEAGEVADKIKKLIRDHNGVLTDKLRKELIKELGDVLWYMSALANELGVELEEVAEQNIKKLQDRKARGVIQGDGDNR